MKRPVRCAEFAQTLIMGKVLGSVVNREDSTVEEKRGDRGELDSSREVSSWLSFVPFVYTIRCAVANPVLQ